MRLLERIQRLDTVEKIAIILGVPTAIVLLLGVTIYWLSGITPSRPKSIATDAVFLWAPAVGFPGGLPRRGDWLSCRVAVGGSDHCRLSTIDGATEYEGDFTPYDNGKPLPAEALQIDPGKSVRDQVWIRGQLVTLIYLRGGEILIPAEEYAKGAKLVKKSRPTP
jgi:hypothetical protein